MNFCLGFTCSARFCELLPEDLEGNVIFLEELVLPGLPLFILVDEMKLNFSPAENTYRLEISIHCNNQALAMHDDLLSLLAEIECLVSQRLLQCFWEIHSLE